MKKREKNPFLYHKNFFSIPTTDSDSLSGVGSCLSGSFSKTFFSCWFDGEQGFPQQQADGLALEFEAGLKAQGRTSLHCSDQGHVSRSGACKLKDKGISHWMGLHYLRSYQEVDLKLRSSQVEKISCTYVVLNYYRDKITV